MAERGQDGRFQPGNSGAWKKGQTGNAGGKQKGIAEYVREKTKDGRDVIDFLLSVMNATGKFAKSRLPIKERVVAAKEIMQRGFGRAPITIELGTGDGDVMKFTMEIGPAAPSDPLTDDPATAGKADGDGE